MTEDIAVSNSGLSEVERVVDTFIAPSKTFTDILRSATWWLPFILMVIVTLANSYTIDKKVGFERVVEYQIHQNPAQEEKMSALTAEQRAAQMRGMVAGYRYSSYGSPIIILVFVAIMALLYWASFNFGLGARTTYGQMFALCIYASLPRLLAGLLSIISLVFGADPDGFDLRNPVGTNPAFYLPDAGPVVKAALSFFDVIGIWVLVLMVIGGAIIAKVSRGKAAAVMVGWWVVGLLLSVGIAAATS